MNKDLLVKVSSIVAICIATVGLLIGFVTVSKLSKFTKEINKTEKFSVQFDKDTYKITPTGSTAVDYGYSKMVGETLTGVIALFQKGDSAIFTWDIVNNGDCTAVLRTTPEIIGLQSDEYAAIDYTITIDGKTAKKGMTIKPGETKTAKIEVIYSTKKEAVLPANNVETIVTTFDYVEK